LVMKEFPPRGTKIIFSIIVSFQIDLIGAFWGLQEYYSIDTVKLQEN